MKRTRIVSMLFVITLVAGCFTPCLGDILPFPCIDKTSFDQYELFSMMHGWYNGISVWFIRTDVNLLKPAFDDYANNSVYWQGLTFAPRLAEAAEDIAPVYFVTNFQQDPVFSAMPGDENYSGLWRVVFIDYHSDATSHPINNAGEYDPETNPYGLPPLTDADRITTDSDGRALVASYPIMATGSLGGQWYPTSEDRYRIPQGRADYNYCYTKQIWLPFWYVYCRSPYTGHVTVRRVIVPDVWDPEDVPCSDMIRPKIGANLARGLADISDAAMQDFYYMNDPKPFSQLPVIQECPTNLYYPWLNRNFEYSPVMRFVTMDRYIPTYTVVNNLQTLYMLENTQRLIVSREDQLFNAPVIPELQLP